MCSYYMHKHLNMHTKVDISYNYVLYNLSKFMAKAYRQWLVTIMSKTAINRKSVTSKILKFQFETKL